MEFSKKLMIFASFMYVVTWIVIVFSIFFAQEVPWELMEKLSWVYGAAVACYCGKSAYENKEKIKGGKAYESGVRANEHSKQHRSGRSHNQSKA